jgi:hypothetical protein
MLKIARGRLQAASEEGFGLIEVIVSAAVLVMVALGTLAALDATAHTAGANQSRTVAASLAEKDLERLRGYRTSELSQLASLEPETRTVKVGKITYTIESKAVLVDDSSGQDVSCAVPSGKGGYLRITSTVTAPMTGNAVKPVTMSSIVAPQPGKGTLTALVHNAQGAPVVKMPVAAAGPSNKTVETNDAGCAIFPDFEAGSYTVQLNYSKWVDPDGKQSVTKNATVSAGNVTLIEFLYDVSGSFPVNVVNSAGTADTAAGVMAAHTGVSTGFRQILGSASAYTFTSMFPFTTPYEVYSGTCTANNPENWVDDYYIAHPEAVALVQANTVGPARTVIEPTIQVTSSYKQSSGTVTFPNSSTFKATVYAYPLDDDCDQTRITVGSSGTDGSGKIPAPVKGLPFGEYAICVQLLRSGTNYKMKWPDTAASRATVKNIVAGGTNLTAQFNSAMTGTCGTTAP